MIIGINGYIGSGKDTVAKIIQILDFLSRYEKAGGKKEDIFYEKGWNWEKAINNQGDFEFPHGNVWKVKKFAKKLKQIASILTGIEESKFEDQEFKKTFLSNEWDKKVNLVVLNDADYFIDQEPYKKMTVRELLQKLGTEAMRDGLHTNVWVNALFADYKSIGYNITESGLRKTDEGLQYPNWIISDLRFPNEFDAIKEREGITIRIDRHPKKINVWHSENDLQIEDFDVHNPKHQLLYRAETKKFHPSENSLDYHTFDYNLRNNGTIEDLIKEVEKMLKHFEII